MFLFFMEKKRGRAGPSPSDFFWGKFKTKYVLIFDTFNISKINKRFVIQNTDHPIQKIKV